MSDAFLDQPAELESVESLVSLHYITSELRRRRHVWIITALIGLLLGLMFHSIVPRSYQASAILTLTHNPNEDPVAAMQTDVSLATTRPVAQQAITALHLPMTSAELLKKYTVISITPQLMKLTANAPSYNEAVARANALANGFLTFRGDQLQAQNQQVQAALNQQIKQAQGALNTLTQEIDSGSDGKGSAELQNAIADQQQDQSTLDQLQATTDQNKVTTATIIGGSRIIDSASPNKFSSLRLAVTNGVTGLIAGLGLGLLFVLIPSLLSDKLRSRYDVARALDAPVNLSIRHRFRLGRGNGREIQTIVDYMHRRATASSAPALPLALVSVDSVKISSLVLDLLAWRLVGEGRRVLIADLTPDATLAKRYGLKSENSIAVAGLRPVFAEAKRSIFSSLFTRRVQLRANAGELTIGRPTEAAVATGPFVLSKQASGGDPAWLEAWAESDVLLTLAELDPAHGAEHLGGWATDAVVMITAGRTSGLKIQSVGNMIRRAGVTLDSAILLDADPHDDSSGILDPVRPPVSRGRYVGMSSS